MFRLMFDLEFVLEYLREMLFGESGVERELGIVEAYAGDLYDPLRHLLGPVFAEGLFHSHGESVQRHVEHVFFATETCGEPAQLEMLLQQEGFPAAFGEDVGGGQSAKSRSGDHHVELPGTIFFLDYH